MCSPYASTYNPFRIALGLLLMLIAANTHAQYYGNEWIEYDQRYYKFPIEEEGVYRISYNTLAAAGVPLANINPADIQLYSRETEVPIYIKTEQPGSFGLSDYIEFYARGNDGWLDYLSYHQLGSQLNSSYSLYNDTINYYLTWQPESGDNLRYENVGNQDLTGLDPLPYVWKENIASFTSNYYYGELDSWGVSTSYFTPGEGWSGPRFGFPSGQSQFSHSIPTPNAYQGADAPNAKFKVVAASNSNAVVQPGYPNHHLQIKYGPNGILTYDETFNGYQVIDHNFGVSPAELSGAATNIQVKVIDDLDMQSDYCAVSSIRAKYAMLPNLTGGSRWSVDLPSDESGTSVMFQFQGVGDNPMVYMRGANPQRITPQQAGSNWRIGYVQNDPSMIATYVADVSQIQNVQSLKPVGAAANGFFSNYQAFNVDSAYVIVTHKSLMTGAQLYANYRNNRFNTFVVEVSELYDQFGGGIEKSGIAIRRFMDMLLHTWDTHPQYLFLLGKSIREAPDNALQGSRKNASYYARNLVPSFGYPSSDYLITAGLLGQNVLAPDVNTGRLAAENNADIQKYLNKVITFESQPPAEWMKNILHFGGGANTNEQNLFRSYLESYQTTIEDTCFGGTVHPFYKTSSEPIAINLSDQVESLINEGVSLMTFFGHAGGSGFDQNIDNPAYFDWNGRYPLLIGNACYTGDIYTPTSNSTSENFTLLEDKGVIGFLSTVKLGFTSMLHLYSAELYRQIAYKSYGKSIGEQVKQTARQVEGDGTNLHIINQVLGMILHGDPAIILNAFPKPDYKIETSGVFFEPQEVSTVQDSLTVNVVIKNIGKATNDSFEVIIERKFPDNGADSVYVVPVEHLYGIDTLRLTIPVQPDRALGENLFTVNVDLPLNLVSELEDYANNSVFNVPLSITSGGVIPVYPYKYAVVPDPEVTLKASSGNPLASVNNYRFQIDTTRNFNSPFLEQMVVAQSGGLIEWPLPFALTDSTVYFWRVARDTTESIRWQQSSFQYIPGKTGWGQAHFQQFYENYFGQLVYNEPEREIDFFLGSVNFRCNIKGNAVTLDQEILLNLDVIEYGGCGVSPALHVAVFDPQTFEHWGTAFEGENPDHNFGNFNNESACRNRVENYFIFRQNNAAQMSGFSNMVLNEVPDGHYLLIYTWRYIVQDALDPAGFYNTMSDLGAAISPSGLDSVPYLVFLKKGSAPLFEEEGENINDELELNLDLASSGDHGAMMSVTAGPVASWGSFHYRFKSQESSDGDTLQVRLIGKKWNNASVDLSGTETDVFSLDEPNLEGMVNAEEFPFISIRANLRDVVTETPPQLKRWHLLYDEVPEAVVNPSEWFVFTGGEVNEGEDALISYAISNASTKPMDSLLVRYWVVDNQNSIHEIERRKIAPLPAGETIIDSLWFETWGLGGNNQLWLEINATDPATGQYDQIEQYHFNNFLHIGFEVQRDKENPLLDVTFDGLHILDGEIVSTHPEISISLTDENLFLMFDQDADTSNVEVYFSEPGGELKRHYFYNGANQNMIWIPASGNSNKFQILYQPEFKKDGTYTMMVRGSDKSGNSSGDNDYRINFEVITQSTITDVLNYPNPFSTKTHFVFTLTGGRVPDYMKIQIMTITGKVVKEITNAELGPIRVGRNITEYYWNGTDQYGDRLANGIYLYRVIAKIDGQSISKRETAAGKYFKQEFGKMYLMR